MTRLHPQTPFSSFVDKRTLPDRLRLTVAIVVTATSLTAQTHLEETGYVELETALGGAIPGGLNRPVMQVEADADAGADLDFAPDESEPSFTGITFMYPGGTGDAPSGHATTVGRYLYGDLSMGIDVAEVEVFDVNTWLNSGFLRLSTGLINEEPVQRDPVVQNHSWIGSLGDDSLDTQAVRRLDFAADRDGFLPVVGLNNGSGSSIPALLAHSYHAVSVGRTNGGHSRGQTTIDGTGRIKPEIVAPTSATSWGTGLVSGAAAVLGEVGSDLAQTGSTDPRTLKAVLLAGATKEEFGGWTRTTTQPLDLVFGAGELNIFHSYEILVGGRQTPGSTPLPANAWSFAQVSPGNPDQFRLEVPRGLLLDEVSAVLTWHREVTIPRFGTITASMEDLALGWWTVTNDSLDTALDSSDSSVDNVEHIWQAGAVGPGTYAFEVSQATGSAVDYALAWRGNLREPITVGEFQTAYLPDATPAEQALDADPDADQIDNLLEYALGLDPLTVDAPAEVISGSVDGREITFPWRSTATDITAVVALSSDLEGPWDTTMAHVELTQSVPLDDDIDLLTYRVVPEFSPEQAFLRVEVTAN